MNTRHLLLIIFIGFSQFSVAQIGADTEPERLKKYMKKEEGKFGLWDKTNKKWLVAPEYYKITGVMLSTKNYEVQNKIFFKLWKGNTFDLLRVTVNTSNYSDEFDIWLKDVSDFRTSNISFDPTSADWYNFVFYRKKGKWGWFARKVDVLRNDRFVKEENVLVEARFDTIPIVTTLAGKQFYTIAPNNYVLKVHSGSNTGLYALSGHRLVEPGLYSNFTLPERIDYGKDIYVGTESQDGYFGYALNGTAVPAVYTAIKKERHYQLNFDYYDCELPGGEHEMRRGTERITKAQLQAMEAANKQKTTEAEMALKARANAAAQSEIKTLIADTGALNPFDVATIVAKGTLDDMLLYCKKFGMEFTASVNNDMREYRANAPFEYGIRQITDAGVNGLIVEYWFKDSEQKQSYQNLLKAKGFEARQVSGATGLLSDGKADIWFIMGSSKWQISRSQ